MGVFFAILYFEWESLKSNCKWKAVLSRNSIVFFCIFVVKRRKMSISINTNNDPESSSTDGTSFEESETLVLPVTPRHKSICQIFREVNISLLVRLGLILLPDFHQPEHFVLFVEDLDVCCLCIFDIFLHIIMLPGCHVSHQVTGWWKVGRWVTVNSTDNIGTQERAANITSLKIFIKMRVCYCS